MQTDKVYYEDIQPTFRVYHDGSNYIGHIPFKDPRRGKRKKKERPFDDLLDFLYNDARKNNISGRGDKIKRWLRKQLREVYEVEGSFAGVLVEDYIYRKNISIHSRKRRFERKANLNPWNYFFTQTYDPKKFKDEDEFRAKFKKTLANLKCRRGYRYVGAFERGQNSTERLHFHALLYVPEGQMIDSLALKRTYDKKFGYRKQNVRNENSFFVDRFGVNDFAPITRVDIKFGKVLQYLMKYIWKDSETFFYSRGVPEFLYEEADLDDIVTEFMDFVVKYIFFGDTFDSFDDGESEMYDTFDIQSTA